MKKIIFCLFLFSSLNKLISQVDLFLPFFATSTPSKFTHGTVLIDITVQNQDVNISSMTLKHFSSGTAGSCTVGARIYSFTPQSTPSASLLLAQTLTVAPIIDGDVTVPAVFTLKANKSYRLGFYMNSLTGDHDILMAQPSIVPYKDNGLLIQVNTGGSYYWQPDSFPIGGTNELPYITLGLSTTRINKTEPTDIFAELFPNPATDKVTLHFKQPYKTVQIKIFNVSCQLMDEQEIHDAPNTVVALENLPKGMYFMTLNTGDQVIQVIKLVKN